MHAVFIMFIMHLYGWNIAKLQSNWQFLFFLLFSEVCQFGNHVINLENNIMRRCSTNVCSIAVIHPPSPMWTCWSVLLLARNVVLILSPQINQAMIIGYAMHSPSIAYSINTPPITCIALCDNNNNFLRPCIIAVNAPSARLPYYILKNGVVWDFNGRSSRW